MADIKSELKCAREAIKNKQYKDALKHCKNVLKLDKENFNGLVFIGVCATELEQFEQGRQAYRKAIGINPGHILAWQGLCTLLERANNNLWNEDLIEGWSKLLNDHVSDEKKWLEICDKLVNLLNKENKVGEAVEWLKKSISKHSDAGNVIAVWKDIIGFLLTIVSCEDPPKERLSQLLNAFESLMELGNLHSYDVEKEAEEFIRFLIKYAKHDYPNKLSLRATRLSAEYIYHMHQNNGQILDLLCSVLVHQNVDYKVLDNDVVMYIGRLLDENLDSFASLLAAGMTEQGKGDRNKAVDYFNQATKLNKEDPIGYFFMAKNLYLLHRNKLAVESITHCRSVLTKCVFNESAHEMEKLVCMMEINMMLEGKLTAESRTKMDLLFKKCQELDERNIEAVLLKVKMHVHLDEIESAIELLNNMEETPIADPAVKKQLLQAKALVSIHERKYYDAELRLHEALELEDDYQSRFLMGKVYLSLGKENAEEYYPKAYAEFLKSAKLDPFYSPTFVQLGVYQKDFIKDVNKAVKCFEKALSLDASNEEAAMCLGDIYIHLGKKDEAIRLYENATSKAQIGEAIWAWVRLGLLFLNGNADRAVVCFQHAIRGKNDVSHYWECLGEAYFQKGSYTSALKAFTKALQVDPSSIFCKFKVAKVKQMLSMDVEAINDYGEVLDDNPAYIPALLGLAETHLHLQNESLKRTFDGRAVDHAQNVLHYISIALKDKPTYTCLWKTAADSLCSLHIVSNDKCRLTIPETLQQILSLEIKQKAGKEMIMEIATKCYMMAIKFRDDIASLWNDLAVCTFHYGMVVKGQSGEEKIRQSMELVKKALALDQTNPVIWNTLGVIAGSPGPSQKVCGHSINEITNPGLSQHAFIKSLEINSLDGSVWTNLGALYLQHDKIEAAHEAFKRAQSADPGLVQAWVGQATIAESIGDDDSMDLFRHATTLSFHREGSIAYAQWVCRLLESIKSKATWVHSQPKADLSHLPEYVRSIVANASVALQKSVERYKGDACELNILGILLEHQALYEEAEKSFSSARRLLNSQPDHIRQAELLRIVLLNQARVLWELQKYNEAIEVYKIINLETVSELSGLALAYYSSGQYADSLKVYEMALSKATCDNEKSAILSAMGMVQYSLKNADLAKSYLLKSSQFEDKSEHGLMALSALGLLHGDGTLTTAALVELSNHKLSNTPSLVEKKAMLLSAFYMLQGQNRAAQRTLNKAIMRYPRNAHLWCRLSKYIIQNNPGEFKSAIHCAKVASSMGPSQMTAKTDAIVSIAFPNAFKQDFIKSVQRFVFTHPEHAESWVLLSSALMADLTMKNDSKSSVVHMTKLALTKVDEALNSVRKSSNRSPSGNRKQLNTYTTLYSWMMQSFVVANIYYGDVSTAHSFCNQIIPSLSGDTKQQELFIFLKGVATMQENLVKGDVSGVENIRVMASLAENSMIVWQWKIMFQLYSKFSMLTSAEICIRRVLQLNMKKGLSNFSILISLCLLALQAHRVSKKQFWLDMGLQVISEVFDSYESDYFAIFLRALLFYEEGKTKAALKYIQKLTFCEDKTITELLNHLIIQWK